MRFSATTPNLPEAGPIPLWLLVRGDDHPKACTGRRLLARRLVRRVTRSGSNPAVVLDPYAKTVLSGQDRARALSSGVVVVDCSWNRLSERHSVGGRTGAEEWGVHRRLPYLLATNPQHYGRLAQLNTVEAFAGALAVLQEREEAERLLAGFHGGPAFLTTNSEWLTRYVACRTPEGILGAERAIFGGGG